MTQTICRNDNHGRAVVSVRFCSSCGSVVNKKIVTGRCAVESHARKRRAQSAFCVDCGEHLVLPR